MVMAELLIRASLQDQALLRSIFGTGAQQPRASLRPDRIVVDAHVPARTSEFSRIARQSGVAFIVDPQTYLFQDAQPVGGRWSGLPFGLPRALTPEEASRPVFLSDLARRAIDYQVVHGATAIIPPYVHIDRPGSEWIDVQAGMWDYARAYLDNEAIALPVLAVMAVGWRMLQPVNGTRALGPMMRALADLAPREVALAASKIDDGAHPDERAMDLVLMVEQLRNDHSVVLWQQGRLGELGIAAGAQGYETGIGWRERCDLPATMSSRRRAQSGGARSGRPVFVAPLGRSVDKRSLEEICHHRDIWTHLICTDTDCCPDGGRAILDNGRAHTVVQRARRLSELGRIETPVWRWQNLAEAADRGLELASRINRLAQTSSSITRVDTRALFAILSVSHLRRLDARARGVA
jgi:hypothetical protein